MLFAEHVGRCGGRAVVHVTRADGTAPATRHRAQGFPCGLTPRFSLNRLAQRAQQSLNLFCLSVLRFLSKTNARIAFEI